MENHESDDTFKKEHILDIINRKINQLPEAERNLLEHGSTYIGLNAALCGLIANSLFRRVLNVTQARIAAGLPMAVIPFLTADISYKSVVICIVKPVPQYEVDWLDLFLVVCTLFSWLFL